MPKNIKIRLYVPIPLEIGKQISLDESQSRYLGAVMRLSEGCEILLFDGQNGEFIGEIIKLRKKETIVKLKKQNKIYKPMPDIWLLFAPVKKDRTDFIIEKATELGASRIIPVITQRTIVEKVRIERFHAQAIEAAEQSERLDVPEIGEAVCLEKLLTNWPSNRLLFFMDESGKGRSALKILLSSNQPAGILVGPEGGFSEEEFLLLKKYSFTRSVSLGPLILRAETAVAAALSLWQAVNGNWGDRNDKKIQ